MLTTNPYLNFQGNTEEAMNFYKTVFGGKILAVHRFKDMPGSERMSPPEQEKIIHLSLDIGKGNILMATDALESLGQKLSFGNNNHICIHAETEKERKHFLTRFRQAVRSRCL